MKTIIFAVVFTFAFTSFGSFSADAPNFLAVGLEETKRLALQGNKVAQLNLGHRYSSSHYGVPQDDEQAAKWFTKSAKQGYAPAQDNLAVRYKHGVGVPKDYKQAIEWYTKAAQQGYAPAQRTLGSIYRYGYGVLQNHKQAIKWYTKAAQQGNRASQYVLGDMYLKGEGILQNYKKAYVWSSLAAIEDHKIAIKNRDFIINKLSPKGLEEAQEETAKLYEIINSKR
jgi:TPR repeat protein